MLNRNLLSVWSPSLKPVESLKSGIPFSMKSVSEVASSWRYRASPSIPEFAKQLANGEFDFAYMNPYHAIVANKQQGYSPVLRDIGRNLYGIIVVRKDSPIQTVNELDGKTVAFPSPNALGAALIPRAEFARKFNIKLNEIYVKSHSSVYLNVLLGKAVAGGGVQKTLSQQPAEIRDHLRVLYKTSEVPSHPLTVHPRVNADIRNGITSVFLDLGKTEPGQVDA